jgi:hypothetical protein
VFILLEFPSFSRRIFIGSRSLPPLWFAVSVLQVVSEQLKSAEVDRGMTAKLEGPTDSHSLALVGGSKGKANTNPSTRMFSLPSLMSMLDEEFDVLREDELALLTRRFERLHENQVNMRRNTRTCF